MKIIQYSILLTFLSDSFANDEFIGFTIWSNILKCFIYFFQINAKEFILIKGNINEFNADMKNKYVVQTLIK